MGWALYLPEEWCEDPERRREAKIPAEVEFQTKPELGVDLIERAAGWEIAKAPVLGDQAYGDNTVLRERLHDAELEYVLSVGAETKVFAPETTFTVPERQGSTGRPRSRPRPDRDPVAISQADRRSRRGAVPDRHVPRRARRRARHLAVLLRARAGRKPRRQKARHGHPARSG